MTVVDSRGPDPGQSRTGTTNQSWSDQDWSDQDWGDRDEVSSESGVDQHGVASGNGDAPGNGLAFDSDFAVQDDGTSPSTVDIKDLGASCGPAWLDSWLEANAHRVVEWRRQIHANPELSRAEHETTALLAGRLTEFGLHPRLLPTGTGLICDIGPDDAESARSCRTIALRADIDALPLAETTGLAFSSTVDGVAHSCGHDAHTAILLGAAAALSHAPSLPGRIRLIFQPAEEVMPGGALDVLAAGGLDGVERIFGLHCDPRITAGEVGTRVGAVSSAADLVELELTSPGGHTSRPQLTADLVHALGTVITGLPTLLSRRVDPRTGTVLSWGSVRAGGAPNAIPKDGVLSGTLRTGDRETWVEFEPLVHELVQGLLAPLGVGFDLRHRRGVPPVVNEGTSTELLRAGIGAAMGDQALVSTNQSSGGEDFGWYLEHVPGSFARLGVRSADGAAQDLHQSSFDLDERALPVGVRVMVNAALRALET